MPDEAKPLRTVQIVVQETGGAGFQVFLAGDIERIGKLPPGELSPAEFWGMRLFQICRNACQQSGAMESVKPKQKV